MSLNVVRKFSVAIVLLFSLSIDIFAGYPMESAKKNITIFQHGINPDKNGLVGTEILNSYYIYVDL